MRLLATVYLEWDCQRFKEKALNAVSLANEVGHEKQLLKHILLVTSRILEHTQNKITDPLYLNNSVLWQECVSTFGLFLKIRILLRCGALDDHIRAGWCPTSFSIYEGPH